MLTEPYAIANEFNITELLEHFDTNYIYDMINDKIEHIDYASILEEPNIIASFEENFKIMNDNYPGDSQNIKSIRVQVYTDIINILCEKFNLQFNEVDEYIDKYTVAFYLYDFLICNRNKYLVNFFTSFIINNKDSLCSFLNLEDYRKSKESAAIYSKRVYDDNIYGIISANIVQVIQHIATLDITLYNIFQSTYTSTEVVNFLDNAILDKGNFFKDYYCIVLGESENMPVIITNIRLMLQSIVGNINQQGIQEIMSYGGEYGNE